MLEEFEDILTVDEACLALRIGKNHLYSMLKDNTLVGYRVGKHWRITKLSLLNYIKENSYRVGR